MVLIYDLTMHLFVFTGVLLTSLRGVHTLMCRECVLETCPPAGPGVCPGGTHLDSCDCCMVCARQEGETCGGPFAMLGKCDSGLQCKTSPVFGQPVTSQEYQGICRKCTTEYEGCNLVDGECVCSKQCSENAFTFPNRTSCEANLLYTDKSSACDWVKCPQSGNEEIVCPPDSVPLPTVITHNGCCQESQGCTCRPANQCPAIQCSPGLTTQIVSKAAGHPGRCCDIIDCINATQTPVSRSVCNYEGKVHNNGDSWNPDKCTTCYCENGLTFCSAVQCVHPPNCAWLTHPDGECCPVCQGCVGHDHSLHNNSDVWRQDECTTCRCEAGQAYCQSSMCDVHCPHPIKVPGRCCGVCDEENWQILIPEKCPHLTNCSIVCPNGFDMDVTGCYVCQCKAECTLHCEHGYKIDKYGTKLCECEEAPNNCPSMDWCAKQCMNGFRKDKNGCPKCRCNKCPSFECTKNCPYGYERNDRGCKLCKCIGEAAITTASPTTLVTTTTEVTVPVSGRPCLSLDGRSLDEGQSWFDGCRQCYCHNGQEMCALITCPVPRCHNPIIRLGDCCPTCLEDTSLAPVSGPAACNASDGSYHAEGDTWRLDQCTRCVCHHGGILCDIESCPPVLCNHPVQMPNKCCPVCPGKEPFFPVSQEHKACVSSSGTVYSHGDMWRTNACQSCTCRSGQIHCFFQTCPLLSCKKTILKKGQCCPYCLDAKPSMTCTYNQDVYGPGETWLQADCQKCVCDSGHAMCTKLTCPKLNCPMSLQIPGKCCPVCKDTSASVPTAYTTVSDHTTWPGGKAGTRFPPGVDEHKDMHFYLIWICVLAAILILLVILIMVLVCYIRRQRRKNTIPTLLSRSQYCTEVKVRPKSTNLDLQGGCPLPTKQSKYDTNNVRMSDLQYMRCSLGEESEKMQKDNLVCLSTEKDSNLSKQV